MHEPHPQQTRDPFPIRESALLNREELERLLGDAKTSRPIIGAREYMLDNKGRFYLPTDWSKSFVDGLVLLRGREGTFFLINLAQSKELFKNLQQQTSEDPSLRERAPHIYNAVSAITVLDKAGRIAIPSEFARRWQLSSPEKLRICGIGSCLEVFTAQSWDQLLRAGTLWDQKMWDSELQLPYTTL